jgi:hypothetical protein
MNKDKKLKKKWKTLDVMFKLTALIAVFSLIVFAVAFLDYIVFGEQEAFGDSSFYISLAVFGVSLISAIVMGKLWLKADSAFLDFLPVIESKAIIREQNSGVNTDGKQFRQLTFETEDKLVQTYNVSAELYGAVMENDVGVLTYKKDSCGVTYIQGFVREGQSISASVSNVCPGCGARGTRTEFDTESTCEYCGGQL